ncbi:MAG TPA: glycosyltransferase family 39 protein [Rhodanobacteraceae bacterium]
MTGTSPVPGNNQRAAHTPRWLVLSCLAMLAVVWFVGLGYRPLFKTDEGRYAEIAREMVVTGNWVTPRLDSFRYFEKPPLQYWATAATYKIFGIHDWCARLWSALTGFLTILLAIFAASRLYGRRSGWIAGAVLAGSFYFGVFGHTNDLDGGLSLALSLAIFGLALGLRAPPRSRAALGWVLVAYAGAALAVLSKGLIGLLLPGATLVLYVVLKRDWRLLHRLYPLRGLVLFFAMTLPWFIAVSIQNHDFLWQFFMVQEFLRFLTPISHRPGAWWYFLPILILAMLPWLESTARAFCAGARDVVRRSPFQPATFLWLWVVLVFVFFSVSHSKLPSYILPIIPTLVVLVAGVLAESRRIPWPAWVLSIVLGLVLMVASLTASSWSWTSPADMAAARAYAPWCIAGGAILLVAGLASCVFRRWRLSTVIGISAAWLICTRLIMLGGAALAPNFSTKALAQSAAMYNLPNVPVYSVDGYQQTLPFYLGRTMTLVAYQGELQFGITHARKPLRGRYLPTLDAFAKVWREHARGLAFAPRTSMPAIHQLGIHYRIVAHNPRWVAFVPEAWR